MNKTIVLVACFFTVFISYSIRYGYGVLLPEMLPSIDITKAEAGVIYASFFIAYTVFSPLLGLMGDRYNVRWLLTVFAAVLGVGTFLMAFASSLLKASLFFTLVGVGSAACWAPVMALTQRWTSEKHRGKTLAFVDIGSALGIVFSSAVLPLVVATRSWNIGWMILGAMGLAVMLMDFLVIRNPPSQPLSHSQIKEHTTAQPVRAVYLKLLKDRKFWLIAMAYLLTGFAIIIPFTFLTTYAVQEMAFPYEAAARLVMVVGISAVVGKIGLGSISDRMPRIYIMMLCALLIGGGSLGIAYGWGKILILFTTIFGIGYGAVWSMYAVSASDYFSKEYAGSIVGLWTLYLGVGSTFSPILAGWIADTTSTLAWSFVLAAVGAAMSFLLLIPVWRATPAVLKGKK